MNGARTPHSKKATHHLEIDHHQKLQELMAVVIRNGLRQAPDPASK